MNDFTVIYRILKALQKSMDSDEFDEAMIAPERLKISETRRNKLLVQLVKNGYVEGIELRKYQDSSTAEPFILPSATITLKGLEYLEDNSMMKKAAGVLKELKDFVPLP
jgi:hypothetical protein